MPSAERSFLQRTSLFSFGSEQFDDHQSARVVNRFAFSPYFDAGVGDERAQPHTHSNQVQQEGHFLALLFAFVRLFGGEPVWTACHEHGATLTAAGVHETTEAMYRAQGQ